jgi:hypothetical protein
VKSESLCTVDCLSHLLYGIGCNAVKLYQIICSGDFEIADGWKLSARPPKTFRAAQIENP